MKTLSLKIDKAKCKNKCPIPLELVSNMEKGINKINYNEKTKLAKIKYDEKLLSKGQIINKFLKMGYRVNK